jgi:hypothetical protein
MLSGSVVAFRFWFMIQDCGAELGGALATRSAKLVSQFLLYHRVRNHGGMIFCKGL